MSAECSVLENILAFQVMSTPPIIAKEGERISDVARKMYEGNVGSVLIVNSDGSLIGIITRKDLIYLLASGIAVKDPIVSRYMSESVITGRENESLKEILDRMLESGVRHVAIVDERNIPKGVISMTDILMLIGRKCLTV